jgi:hypothetical protein
MVADALHAHIADNITVEFPFVPNQRTRRIAPQNRTAAIARERRAMTVAREDRAHTV